MTTDSDFSLGKYLVGVAIGVALSWSYVRFGFEMPGVLGLGQKISTGAIVTAAETDLYNPDAPAEVRQRALAVIVGQEPKLFIEVDAALGGRFMEEVLRRRAVRKAKLLKQQMSAYDTALAQPALRRLQEEKHGVTETEPLKRRMLLAALGRDEFLQAYLTSRYARASDEQIVDIILDVYRSELQPERVASVIDDGRVRQ